MKVPQPADPKVQYDRKKSIAINVREHRKRRRKGEKAPSFKKILENLLMPLIAAFEEFTYLFPSIEDVVKTSILACIERTTINTICDNLDNSLSARTVRHYLGCLKNEKIEEGLNELLRNKVVALIKNKWVRLSMDFVQLPYYGDYFRDEKELTTGKAKKGTTTFHTYLTVYAVVRNQRYTIAIKYVRKEQSVEELFKEAMEEILGLGLNIKTVLLDKEFYQVRIINYLKEKEVPAIIAVPQRGKKIKALRVRRKGARCVTWTIRNSQKEEATFLLQCFQKYMKGSKVLGGRSTWFFYATIGMKRNPRRTAELYRKRFGIESTYRMMDSCRARTTSQNPVIRLFFVLIAFMITNLKVLYEWLSVKDGRISRRISNSLMSLARLIILIRKALEGWFKKHYRRKRRIYQVG